MVEHDWRYCAKFQLGHGSRRRVMLTNEDADKLQGGRAVVAYGFTTFTM